MSLFGDNVTLPMSAFPDTLLLGASAEFISGWRRERLIRPTIPTIRFSTTPQLRASDAQYSTFFLSIPSAPNLPEPVPTYNRKPSPRRYGKLSPI